MPHMCSVMEEPFMHREQADSDQIATGWRRFVTPVPETMR